jgi:isopentenyl diphosphate isomerase/L-lactate dehydrogenase-like FMN-dependent dehydrogenase
MTAHRATAAPIGREADPWHAHPDSSQSSWNVGALVGLIVSNHGGRQLDTAPAPAAMLPAIRQALPPAVPVLADGGCESGVNVLRYLALGADLVLAARVPYLSVAAMGEPGAQHILDLWYPNFHIALWQLGCDSQGALRNHLHLG